jgi:predicted O-methyltransferase YrrM
MIVHPAIERYIETLPCPRQDVFIEMEERARRENFPIVGPGVGRLLQILVASSGARRILELGSGFGYSALWMALALPPGGSILALDNDPNHRDQAQNYAHRLGVNGRIEFQVGDALALARQAVGPFDFIFNDVDKQAYPETIAIAHSQLRLGGLFVTDNSLWQGEVVQPVPHTSAAHVDRFNHLLAAHPGFTSVQVPLRDGLALALKVN